MNANIDAGNAFLAQAALVVRDEPPQQALSDYWITRYCAGDLSDSEHKKVEALIAGSSENYQRWYELRAAYEPTAVAVAEPAHPSYMARFTKAVRNVLSELEWQAQAAISTSVAACALLAVVVLDPNVLSPGETGILDTGERSRLAFPFGEATAELKSLNTSAAATSTSAEWPERFLVGVRATLETQLENSNDWALDAFPALEGQLCDDSNCSPLETRQFAAGEAVAGAFIACEQGRLDTAAQYQEQLAPHVGSYWWRADAIGPEGVCPLSRGIFESIYRSQPVSTP